ncbi:MAG: NAD(+)/NADH kinase [Candidatus Aenigmarchaeota archaeon]|nr:NAD(+)/NADH kinase [Candidatus Aenigmarchaeota archaeon]
MPRRKERNRKKKGRMNILLVAKQNPTGIKAAKAVYKRLHEFADVHLDLTTSLRLRRPRGTALKKFNGDVIITLGGDGTFLWAAYQAKVPILPVRIEGHGFLCTIDYKDFLKEMEKIRRRDYFIEKRMRLKCTAVREKLLRKIFGKPYPLSLNEIAFARKRPSKVLNLSFKIDDTVFDLTGDGAVFSTPSGSSAYAASAGGPIIDPSLEAITVVPLYPFHSHIKPIIMPADKKIEVEIVGGDCALIIDGHGGEYVKRGAKFFVERGDSVKIVHLKEHRFYHKYKSSFLERKV